MSQTTRTEEPLGNTKGDALGNRGKWATAQLAQGIVTSLPSLTLEMSNVWSSLLLLVFVYLFVWLVWTRARYKLLNTTATSHHKKRPECWWSWPCIFFKLSPNLCTLCFLGWWHQAKSWSLPIRSHNPLRGLTIQIQGDRQRDRGYGAPCPPSHQLGCIWQWVGVGQAETEEEGCSGSSSNTGQGIRMVKASSL